MLNQKFNVMSLKIRFKVHHDYSKIKNKIVNKMYNLIIWFPCNTITLLALIAMTGL